MAAANKAKTQPGKMTGDPFLQHLAKIVYQLAGHHEATTGQKLRGF